MSVGSHFAWGTANVLLCQKGEGVFTYCNVLNIHLPVMYLYTWGVEMEVHVSITLMSFHCFCIFPYSWHLHMKCQIFLGKMYVSYYFSFTSVTLLLYPVQKVPPLLEYIPKAVLGHREETSLWVHQNRSWANIDSASCNCLPKPKFIYLLTLPLPLFDFFLLTNDPSKLFLLEGLYCVPLPGTKPGIVVFFSGPPSQLPVTKFSSVSFCGMDFSISIWSVTCHRTWSFLIWCNSLC